LTLLQCIPILSSLIACSQSLSSTIKFAQGAFLTSLKIDAKENFNGNGEEASSLLMKVNTFKPEKRYAPKEV
jgi:hypothetical protein